MMRLMKIVEEYTKRVPSSKIERLVERISNLMTAR